MSTLVRMEELAKMASPNVFAVWDTLDSSVKVRIKLDSLVIKQNFILILTIDICFIFHFLLPIV